MNQQEEGKEITMKERQSVYDEMYGTSVCIYDKTEKEFIRTNPICRDCLVRPMCIEQAHSRIGIKVRVCERLYKYFQMVKKNDKNLIKFK
jgi:hypothetical protein